MLQSLNVRRIVNGTTLKCDVASAILLLILYTNYEKLWKSVKNFEFSWKLIFHVL